MAPELASKKFGTEKSSGTVMGKIWCRRIPGNFTFFGRYRSQYRKNLVLQISTATGFFLVESHSGLYTVQIEQANSMQLFFIFYILSRLGQLDLTSFNLLALRFPREELL